MSGKTALFSTILRKCQQVFTSEVFETIRTKKGNTQQAERIYITKIRTILEEMKLGFTEAGSQQPYDFRIEMENGEKLLLEAKKADSLNIYFNDTCPCEDGYYIIIFTGKFTKSVITQIPPCVVGANGNEFIEKCPWVKDYQQELNLLKEKYRHMPGNMSVYPRPTFKSDISFILERNGIKKTVEEIEILEKERKEEEKKKKEEEKKKKEEEKKRKQEEKKKLKDEEKKIKEEKKRETMKK